MVTIGEKENRCCKTAATSVMRRIKTGLDLADLGKRVSVHRVSFARSCANQRGEIFVLFRDSLDDTHVSPLPCSPVLQKTEEATVGLDGSLVCVLRSCNVCKKFSGCSNRNNTRVIISGISGDNEVAFGVHGAASNKTILEIPCS